MHGLLNFFNFSTDLPSCIYYHYDPRSPIHPEKDQTIFKTIPLAESKVIRLLSDPYSIWNNSKYFHKNSVYASTKSLISISNIQLFDYLFFLMMAASLVSSRNFWQISCRTILFFFTFLLSDVSKCFIGHERMLTVLIIICKVFENFL